MESTKAEQTATSTIHPRTARARGELLAAAVDVLATEGFTALTMDRLAAEARSSKQTIYRLWSSKEDLIADALMAYVVEFPDPDTGSVRDDLEAIVRRQIHVLHSTRYGQALRATWPFASVSEGLRERILLAVRKRRARATTEVVRRAIARGELREDTDIEMLLEILLFPALVLIAHYHERPDDTWAARLVTAVLRAYGTPDLRERASVSGDDASG